MFKRGSDVLLISKSDNMNGNHLHWATLLYYFGYYLKYVLQGLSLSFETVN